MFQSAYTHQWGLSTLEGPALLHAVDLITVHSGYPAVPSQVTAVAIKESYNPLRPNAGSSRQELPPQAVSAVQQQGNSGLLSKLNEVERSHVLSYQVCQLLDSLSAVKARVTPNSVTASA